MRLYQRIEQILFRPVFSREATFEWFLLLFWGVLLTTQPPNVASAPEIPAGTTITGGVALFSRINDDLAAPLVAV
jgi:hypothetical protein